MVAGVFFCIRKIKLVVQANWYGKLATVVFFIAIILTIVINSEDL